MIKIDINHLGYKIIFRKPTKSELKMMQSKKMVACCIGYDHESAILMTEKVTMKNVSTLSHEVLHAIQNLCRDRHINMAEEKENIGYMMNYCMNRILGYEYNI